MHFHQTTIYQPKRYLPLFRPTATPTLNSLLFSFPYFHPYTSLFFPSLFPPHPIPHRSFHRLFRTNRRSTIEKIHQVLLRLFHTTSYTTYFSFPTPPYSSTYAYSYPLLSFLSVALLSLHLPSLSHLTSLFLSLTLSFIPPALHFTSPHSFSPLYPILTSLPPSLPLTLPRPSPTPRTRLPPLIPPSLPPPLLSILVTVRN